MTRNGATLTDKELNLFISHFTLPEKISIIPRNKRKKVIVISGPTAVGKTKLSLFIARILGGEVISADSMQVYKGMDIGTAKVAKEEQALVPHHLIDIRELQERFNVVDFYAAAHKSIEEVLRKGAVPIVAGGTGFYLHALIYGPPSGPPSVQEIRVKLEQEMEKRGAGFLFAKLQEFDPEYAATITPMDKQKIIRALEIITITRRKVTAFAKQHSEEMQNYDFRCWFLYMPKEELYPKIDLRCEEMVKKGFIEEVKELLKKGLKENRTASQAIGYRQCLDFLETVQSSEDFQKFLSAFKQSSRRYAKRQFTWFRKEPLFRWINVHNISFEKVTEMILQDYEQSF